MSGPRQHWDTCGEGWRGDKRQETWSEESGKVRPERNRGCQASSWKPRNMVPLESLSPAGGISAGLRLSGTWSCTPC